MASSLAKAARQYRAPEPAPIIGAQPSCEERDWPERVPILPCALGAELTAHLGHEASAEPPPEQTNHRNGVATKRVKGSDGEVPLSLPRDRGGSFEPELVKKGQARIDDTDDRIIGL